MQKNRSTGSCLNALRQIFRNDPDGYSVDDMVELTGISINTIRCSARHLCSLGELSRELEGHYYLYKPTELLQDPPITNEVQETLKPKMPGARIIRFETPYSSPDAIGSHSSLAWNRPAGSPC